MSSVTHDRTLAGTGGDDAKLPGHWILARLGKRVLRPGGRELTGAMLAALDIAQDDHVIEFAPGLGATARLTMARGPASYTAIERDPSAAEAVAALLDGDRQRLVQGTAQETGLPAGEATVVYGEAMLTMQSAATKQQIVAEAARLLQPGGRYGIHELCLTPDELPAERKSAVEQSIGAAIHHAARPLTVAEWRELLAASGFRVVAEQRAPMALLEPRRLVADEGLFGALRFAFRMLTRPTARRRVLAMRRTFRAHRHELAAIMLVAIKEER